MKNNETLQPLPKPLWRKSLRRNKRVQYSIYTGDKADSVAALTATPKQQACLFGVTQESVLRYRPTCAEKGKDVGPQGLGGISATQGKALGRLGVTGNANNR